MKDISEHNGNSNRLPPKSKFTIWKTECCKERLVKHFHST